MDKLGGPLVLVAAVWGLFSALLKAIEMLNERRDLVLGEDPKLTARHRRLILYSDWLTIYVSAYAFIGFVGMIVYASSAGPPAGPASDGAVAAWMAAHVPEITGATLVGMSAVGLASGWTDFSAMRRHLRTLERPAGDDE